MKKEEKLNALKGSFKFDLFFFKRRIFFNNRKKILKIPIIEKNNSTNKIRYI